MMIIGLDQRHSPKATLLFYVPFHPPLAGPPALSKCRRRSPTCAQTRTPPKYPRKKPYGYWKHLPNVLSELENHMSSLTPRPNIMPTAHELSAAGRQDLAGAIRRHSWQKVAAAARLPLSSYSRPRSLNLSFCTRLQTDRIRPHMYWRDWGNVEKEIRQFIHQRAKDGNREDKEGGLVMPTTAELVDHGRSDLKRAISLHGGVREVAKRLGLIRKSRPVEYWNEARIIDEMKRVMQCTGNTTDVPAVEDMRQFGERGLLSAVRRLGGTRAVAKLIGMSVRRKPQKR